MKKLLLSVLLLSSLSHLQASDVKYFGKNAVIPDAVQQEAIAASIEALVDDCQLATKIEINKVMKMGRGLEVTFSTPITFHKPPAGEVTNVTRIIIVLWDNAEKSMGMDIYAYAKSDIYLLGKYSRLGYPIINMIVRPMRPNNSPM